MLDSKSFSIRLEQHLVKIYGGVKTTKEIKQVSNDLLEFIESKFSKNPPKFLNNVSKWSEKDTILISYPNSIVENKRKPLSTLKKFLDKHCMNMISIIHILPFFPSSSDQGFSVKDYYSVDKNFGSWDDIKRISQKFSVMGDVVLNHGSSKSKWFENFLNGSGPGSKYFLTADKNLDLSTVTRPRTSDLLSKVDTANGEKYVWCTFSEDQVDYDFENFEVLKEFISIITFYLENGISVFRFDAVAFLWKKIGTGCVNLPETHEIVRLFRTILDYLAPSAILVTETNTPARENVTYFGNANEAHWIYNFSLPPILIYTVLKGDSSYLEKLTMSLPPAQLGASYLNFVASHDGIGLRPIEGMMSKREINKLINKMKNNGGEISYRINKDNKESPYEINISLFDAMQETLNGNEDFHFDRFLCIHIIMLSLEGVPAFYIHSLFGTKNDQNLYSKTNKKRDLNRHVFEIDNLKRIIDDENNHGSFIFYKLKNLIAIRKKQTAFHPNAVQFTLHLGKNFYGVWRQSLDKSQSIFCITNVTDENREFSLMDINLIGFDQWRDLISNKTLSDIHSKITLKPYQTIWVSNK